MGRGSKRESNVNGALIGLMADPFVISGYYLSVPKLIKVVQAQEKKMRSVFIFKFMLILFCKIFIGVVVLLPIVHRSCYRRALGYVFNGLVQRLTVYKKVSMTFWYFYFTRDFDGNKKQKIEKLEIHGWEQTSTYCVSFVI